MTVRDLMGRVDTRIFASQITRAIASFGSNHIAGAFFQQPREIQFPEGGVMGITLSFECQWQPAISTLVPQDEISIDDYGAFRFLREIIPGGDESGLTVLELGEIL
jgi:hypothetical protein